MPLLLTEICWVATCNHDGCMDHRRRAYFRLCYGGQERLAARKASWTEWLYGYDQATHSVEMGGSEDLSEEAALSYGWKKRGPVWVCPECVRVYRWPFPGSVAGAA